MRTSTVFVLLCLLGCVSCFFYPSRPEGTGWRLIQTSEKHAEWVQGDVLENLMFGMDIDTAVSPKLWIAVRLYRRFKDVTSHWEEGSRISVERKKGTIPDYPTPNPTAHPEVSDLFKLANADSLESIVKEMTSLQTRYYKSKESRQASEFVRGKVEEILKKAGTTDVTVEYIDNTGYDQPNVIVKIPAKEGSSTSSEISIVGAHIDSICSEDCSGGKEARAPGADDDASGSATVLEIFRLIVEGKWRGKRQIHFMWFAAEEPGLLGSATVAKQYKKQKANQLTTSGYHSEGNSMTTLTDPNSKFANYLYKIAQAYVPEVPIIKDSCGYACSDQWSFDDEGFPAGMYIESEPTDPYVHSIQDTYNRLDFDGMVHFVKVGVAWLTEVSR
ncbi:hypothetical protein PROFUN_14348 [Planoprotostelium fungivorum]|uniref:Peptidase M28 domain-containing protein n=1 Tax=Planoprotostelium fungivorum TaxID=1890364 RepID=A0A2P6MZY7_9EUKA|nr:hypothetical protein PROFUN_14348 [Planoprotostelium fungivorum]